MNPIKWLAPIVCASTSLLAQATGDMNTLISAAAHYVSAGVAGSHSPATLALSKIVGNNNNPQYLMTKATDVVHWTFLYQISNPETAGTAEAKPLPHLSAQAECTSGVFSNFHYSDKPIKGVKSLEYTWAAVTLDTAISNLNANGYVRGFSNVALQRPDLANWPDDYVYVFTCPWERQEVAISCQTGALTWTYGY